MCTHAHIHDSQKKTRRGSSLPPSPDSLLRVHKFRLVPTSIIKGFKLISNSSSY